MASNDVTISISGTSSKSNIILNSEGAQIQEKTPVTPSLINAVSEKLPWSLVNARIASYTHDSLALFTPGAWYPVFSGPPNWDNEASGNFFIPYSENFPGTIAIQLVLYGLIPFPTGMQSLPFNLSSVLSSVGWQIYSMDVLAQSLE